MHLSVSYITDFVFKIGKSYHLQVFLEDCKYIIKEKKINKYINIDLDISFADSDEEDSDEPDDKAMMKKNVCKSLFNIIKAGVYKKQSSVFVIFCLSYAKNIDLKF